MRLTTDVVVIGCGGFGSAALFHLTQRGADAVGVDQYAPPHDQGSSSGETRVIRRAYFEHPDYVPLLNAAYPLWDRLAADADEELFIRSGLVLAGPASGTVIAGTRAAAAQHGLTLDDLSPHEAARRFPLLSIPDGLDVVYEQDAGFLRSERCVAAHLTLARRAGARLLTNRRVVEIRPSSAQITVSTDDEQIVARCAIMTAGAWTGQLLSRYRSHISVLRKSLFWFPANETRWGDFRETPVHLMDLPDGQFYGFPSMDGRTVKLAEHTGGDPVGAVEELRRTVMPAEELRVARYAQQCLKGVGRTAERSAVCMYSMSPDGHFLLDHDPERSLVVAAGFSGHGFKFTSVLGQAVAELATSGCTRHPVAFLSSRRLSAEMESS